MIGTAENGIVVAGVEPHEMKILLGLLLRASTTNAMLRIELERLPRSKPALELLGKLISDPRPRGTLPR